MKSFIVCIATAVSLLSSIAQACTGSGNVADPVHALSVGSSSFTVSDGKTDSWVTTLGSLKNTSTNCIYNIVVEVKYFDNRNTLIDTVTQPLYDGNTVAPSQEVTFRIRDVATRPKDAYASQAVRIVSAYSPAAREGSQTPGKSIAWDLFVQWLPIMVLIGVWLFAMRRFRAKDSPQAKSLALLERQTQLFERQNELIERLAAAQEARASRND